MSHHAAEHEDLLHAHLSGDLARDDARLVERLQRCPACRERLDELRSLTVLLDRLGGEQRASLTPPAATAPGSERVAATLQALAQGGRPTPLRPVPAPTRRATLWRVGLAAASVVAAGWVVKSLLPEGSEVREDVLLGDRKGHSVTPSGTVEAYPPFDWKEAPEGASSFKVRIWAEGQSVLDDPLEWATDRLPWNPSTDELDGLPDSIQFEIVAYDGQGDYLESSGRESARLLQARSD